MSQKRRSSCGGCLTLFILISLGASLIAIISNRGEQTTVPNTIAAAPQPDARDENGMTPLMVAARDGKSDVVKLLIEKGADFKATTVIGNYDALAIAAKNGQKDVVEILLDKGSNANRKDSDGDTAIMLAQKENKIEVVDLFKDRGYAINSALTLSNKPQPQPPTSVEQLPAAPPLSLPRPPIDTVLLSKGKALYEKLKRDYPDAPMPPDADLAPHTVNISMTGTIGAIPILDLSMPSGVWNKLSRNDKNGLAALLQSTIRRAKEEPEAFAWTKPEAPAYAGEIDNIRAIKDNAWEISIGHLDNEGYLNEDSIAMRGTDYDASPSNRPVFVYANAKDDPVYNSGWDGSVSQVEDYHKKHLNDPDSVQYSNWTKVIKTGAGYQVSVTFREKNELAGYVTHDQTFDFDKQGIISNVRDNDQ